MSFVSSQKTNRSLSMKVLFIGSIKKVRKEKNVFGDARFGKTGFKAGIHTDVDRDVLKRLHDQNHDGSGARIEILQSKEEMPIRAGATQETTSQVIQASSSGLSIAAQGQFNLETARRFVRRRREIVGGVPAAPDSLVLLNIPDEFR